jgi:hypothetical protein
MSIRTLSLTLVLALGISTSHSTAEPLVLTINTSTQKFDWLNNTSITRIDTGDDNNQFGIQSGVDAEITAPLASYSGNGTHSRTVFHVSADGSVVEGLGFTTSFPPGLGATFSGTPEGPASPVFLSGSFASFANLSLGTYDLAPIGPWNGPVQIQVVPESGVIAMVAIAFFAFGWARQRRGCTRPTKL